MNLTEPDILHAWLDGELPPDQATRIAQRLADDADAAARVATWRAQKQLLHDRYDAVLTEAHDFDNFFGDDLDAARPARWWPGHAFAAGIAAVVIGVSALGGWYGRDLFAPRLDTSFAATAAIAYAAYVPEVRHPVEVGADQEAHLTAWLSKRLGAPVRVPHLTDAGWDLLGGRLLPAEAGPLAQFMYQDRGGRRMTLLVSHSKSVASRETAFRHEQRGAVGVFYWVDGGYAYAMSAELPRADLLALSDKVYKQLNP